MSVQAVETLPEGWELTTIGERFDSWGGHTPSKANSGYWGDGLPWVSSREVKATRITSSTHSVTQKAVDETGLRVCPVGSVLVVVRSGILAHSLPVAITDAPVTINQDMKAFYSDEPLLNEWLALFLRSSANALLRSSRREGTTVQSVQFALLKDTVIPIPPRDQRKQIIDVLERALDKQSSALPHVSAAKRAIESFRQAVLAAASSGRLTADWREQNPDIEGAEKLVSQPAYSIEEPEDGLSELPDKWAWVALGNYARCSRGRFSVRPRNDPSCFGGEHPFIQIGSLNPNGGWVRSHTQTLNAKGLSVSKRFPKGTAVIAIVGATIGNTGLLAYDMCFPDSLVGLETGTPEGNRFVELFLRDRKHIIREASYSSGGQPNIKLESLNPYPLALPPLAEQREIVRRVDRLLTLVDELQRRVDTAARSVKRSSQAVLAKAFRGELVTTGEGVDSER